MRSGNQANQGSLGAVQITATWRASRQKREAGSGAVPSNAPDLAAYIGGFLKEFLADATSCQIVATTSPGDLLLAEELRLTVAPIATAEITSEAVKADPPPRNRTRIAVGEEVNLTYSEGDAAWGTTAGTLSSNSGVTVLFTAPATAQNVTVSATGGGGDAAIQFTIVAPSEINMIERAGSLRHIKDRPDIGMKTDIYIGPDDVNFYNIETKELDVGAEATGVYSCFVGVGHDPGGPVTLSDNVVAGRGTKVNAIDNIYSGDCGTEPPFTPGYILFNIPNQYQVAGGAWQDFITTHQRCELAADASTLTANKAGAYVETTVDAPTSP